jgi:hypothetical protein
VSTSAAIFTAARAAALSSRFPPPIAWRLSTSSTSKAKYLDWSMRSVWSVVASVAGSMTVTFFV